ncbi:MAG: hypothetical protein JWN98_1821, partial [Abditibacteriota bacterium]|nr:hypothetical protein [Abditibacteriota bacterium]
FLPSTLLHVRCGSEHTKDGLTLWLDGAMVEEKAEASPEYAAAQPVELSLQLPRSGHVVHDGEKANVRVLTAGTLPQGARLRCTATRLWAGNPVESVWNVKLPATHFALPDFKGRRGMWKLSAEVVDAANKVLSPPYEVIWARLTRPREIYPTKSFFGAHIQLSPDYIAMARAIGVRRVRLHDTSMIAKWPIAEVEPGIFRYYDEGVTHAKKSGLAILGMLDGAPRWVSTKSREGYWGIWHIPDAPGALEKWDTYVRNVTTHYRGRIDEWEVWNEPWGNWFDGAGGTPELYGQLMQRAYRVAKKANPKAFIIGVDAYPKNGWTPRVMPFVQPLFYDGFSYHEYNDAIFGGPEAIPVLRKKEFYDWQAKYGTPRPLWNTEGGLFGVGSWYTPAAGGMDVLLQPSYIVRYDVTHMAAGVRAFWLYAVHTDGAMGEIETRTTEHDRAVKPILAARAVLASLVDGVGAPTRSEPVKGVDLYTYPRDAKNKRTISVLWSYDGANHAVKVPRGTTVLDVWGNPMSLRASTVTATPEPKYFVR